MRINIYAEELTDRIELVETTAKDHGAATFYGCRIYLKTHEDMVPPKHQDDDSSAVTFWFTSKLERLGFFRELLDGVVE